MNTTHRGPQMAQDAFFLPRTAECSDSLRKAVEAQIETLLAFLDRIDPDPDLEQTTSHDDCELERCDDEDSHDLECVR